MRNLIVLAALVVVTACGSNGVTEPTTATPATVRTSWTCAEGLTVTVDRRTRFDDWSVTRTEGVTVNNVRGCSTIRYTLENSANLTENQARELANR